ncbi:MAG: potassium channel family protein [Thiohalomonadales bacterium]
MIFKLIFDRQRRRRKIRYYSNHFSISVQGRLVRLFFMLIVIIGIHTTAISFAENISLWAAFWLTLTTMTTVGYGDVSAQSFAGQLITIGLIYIIGIWLLAQLASEYLDYRHERHDKMAKGHWRWKKMRDHILIINAPKYDRDRYLTRLIEQVRNTPEFACLPLQILTDAYENGLPQNLRDMGLVHYSGTIDETGALVAINADKAKYIIILAEHATNARSDSVTIDTLDRLKHLGNNAYILAECVQDDNRPRFLAAQANSVIRPIRAYPEIIVRALVAPGVEQILENLFRHRGDSTYRFDIKIEGHLWRDIACQLITADLGTPLGYIEESGVVVTNPSAMTRVTSKALILLVREESIPTKEQVQRIVAPLAENA